MIHPDYKIACETINDLSEVNDEANVYYNYKNIHFHYKRNNPSKNLVIAFNGAISVTHDPNMLRTTPVFRNYYNKQCNVLNISDKLLEDFSEQKIILGWFICPDNTNYFEVYTEIIRFFIEQYDQIIFQGSSAGGFPSLLFASYFTKYYSDKIDNIRIRITALALNSQLYLEKYFYFKTFIEKTGITLDYKNYDIEHIITKHGSPMRTYIYVNENDIIHYDKHFTPFKQFITNNGLQDKYTFESFIGAEPIPPKIHHTIFIPPNQSENDIINMIFKDNNH
jgi:hypothetical protein